MRERKEELRRDLLTRRNAERGRNRKTKAIADRVRSLPMWTAASVVLAYVGVKSEVGTLELLRTALDMGKTTVVPVVGPDDLTLIRILTLQELTPAQFGLLEPSPGLRGEDRQVDPSRIDLVLAPGVGFDRQGGRLGYGKGYFDRLLRRLRPDAAVVALAFECQVVDSIPMGLDDTKIPCLVTESGVFPT